MKTKKIILGVLTLALFMGLLNILFPHQVSMDGLINAIQYESEVDPVLTEAKETLRLYSEFNNQTLTDSKLAQLTTNFYLPIEIGSVTIDWSVDTEYISIDSNPIVITVSSIDGSADISVLKATIVEWPTALTGNIDFSIVGILHYHDLSDEVVYHATLVPQIPADFWGGVFFTFVRYVTLFLEGVGMTLFLSLTGTVVGFFLALILVLMRMDLSSKKPSKFRKVLHKVLSGISKIYVTVFRGTPMIVQAAFFWYGLGLFGNAMLCGLFVVSLNTAAYIAEILRGGIQSIDSGQTEASRSLGLSALQTMVFVIFPQAIKNSMPSIGNEFVINIKDTSVLSIIGIFELFNQTRKIAGIHYRQLEAYFVVALIYLFLTYTVTHLLAKIEKRLDMPVKELPSSN